MEKGYSLIQAAEYLGVKVRTIRQWIRDGKIKANKIEGTDRWIILESEVESLKSDIDHLRSVRGYTLPEVAEFLGIKTRTVRKWLKDGLISGTKISGRGIKDHWIVDVSEIKRLQGS